MKSKKLQKYQNSGPVSQSKDSGIITFESNPEYFNNRTFEKWQIKLLSSGEFGVDPKTNAIHKLKKPVSVPQEWLDVTSGNYEGSGTQRRFQAEAGLNQAYQNPLMYAPGSIGLGAYLTPAIRAGIPGAMEMLNAPLQIGSKTINPVTIANLATAAGAAQAPENIVSGVQNIIKGNYTEGAAGIGMAALDLIGPESISAAKPIGNYLRNLGNPAAGLDPLKYFKKQPIPGTNLYGRDSRSPFEEMLYNFYSKKSGGNKNGSNKKWSTIEPGDPINDATPPPKQEEVYETPTNIPLDYFSRRNKSIDISGTSALDILDSQAVKELKKSGESLNNFVNRVKTPEGRRRAKELGIDDVDSFVGRVSIHPFYDKPSYQTLGLFESKPIHAVSLGGDKFNPYEIRHELQHAIDTESNPLNTFGGLFMDDVPTSKIAEDLGKLKLKPSSGRKYKEDISHFSKDTEKPAFLSEIQEYLMQNNIVKNAYDRITPEDVMAGYKHSVDTKSNNGRLFKLIDETDYDNFKIISNNLNKMLSATPLVGLGAISSQQNKEQDTQKYQSGGAIMKTQKKKGLQKYQDSGYTKAPYNDPFASIFSNALGSGLYAYTNNNPFLNTHDSILGQPLATSVGEQGAFLGSLPMFQQLNKPLGSWDQESKGIENSLFEADGKKYGTAGSWKKTAEAWAKETGQDPRGYEKYVQDRAGQNYDSTVSAQKQWNEFGKPLAANMFAIDELNKLTEKSYNQGLKLDAQDLTKGTKGQEFRGFFAQNGMRVGNFQGGGISSFPYLSGMQDVPRSPIKDRKAQPSKVKSTLDNILEAVGINTGINAVSELSKVPALDTFYDLYNIADSYRQGDPFKATINEVGALIPGLSGKVIEAAVEDFVPKFPDNAKKKMKFILKQSSGENMKLSEKYGQVYWDNPQFQKDYKDEIDNLEQGGSIKILHRSMGADVTLPIQRFQNSGGTTNNLLSSIGVSQAQQDNSRLTNLNPTDKLDYFKVLAGYVKQNGIEALKSHPVEFDFFTRTAEEVKEASAQPTQTTDPTKKDPPVEGGVYVEAEIKDKRQQEDKEETTTPKKTKRPDFSSKVGVTNAAQSFDAMLEYLAASSQDTQMSKDDYYNVLMQVEEDKRKQNPDSNIYTSARMPYSPSTSGQSELIRSLGRGSVNAFQSGGQINQLQQIMGYKDGSPFANLPFQTINSNSITMDGVSQPLLAIADNGERRVLPPNSGLHNFQGANSVMEVPMAQNGGSLNLHKLGIFQSGGNTNNLTKLDTDKGAPYEYYYDNTTEDYYIKTPSGQLTKTEKGSDTYNKMANTYGTTVHKKETQQKPLNGKIIRDESDPYDYFYDEETKRYAFRKRGETDLWRIVDPNSSRGAAIKKVVDEAVEYNNGLKGAKEPKGFIENYLIDPIKDIFGFQNGGVLQYQLGGNPKPLYVNPSNPTSINQVYGQEKQGMTEAERSAREFHENEMDSPGYFKKVRDMLPASIPEFKRDYEAANVIKARKAALRETRNTGATIPSTSGAAGQYDSNKGTVSFQGKSSQTIDYEGEKLEMNEQHPHQEVGTNVHELSHASTRGGAFELQDEANYMKNRAKGTDPYYTNPGEIKARMDVLKAYAVSLGWVKPGENISKKHLELIGLKSKLGDGTDGAANAYKELIEKAGLTDDDLVDIWKNIASAPSNTSDVSTMARNGGRLNIFQQGGIPMQQMTPEELIRSYVDRGMTWDQPKLTPEELIRSYVDKNRTSGSISESAKRDNVLRDFLKSYENPNIDWSPQEMTPEELVRSYVNKNKTTGSISGSAKRDNTLRDFLKSYENPNINWDSTEMTPDELIRSMIQRGVVNKKQGGRITSPINLSKNINPFRLSPINSFGLGGFIRDGVPSRPKSEVGFSRQPISGASKRGPMGPKATDIPSYNGGVRKLMDMPDNEYISTENLIPIQTEKGEMIVMPTGDLVKVMATKRHHQMDEDEVTDVAPEGAYILSSFGKVRINKDEAEQIITETGVKPYRIGGIQDSPTEKNLASMMTKKSMSPADIAKRVDRFFPVNSTSNPFELAANNENKTHRVPYLEGLIQLSELDKLRKGIDSGMESQQQENEDEMTEAFKNGGSTWGGVPMRNMLIPKFGDPGSTSGGIPNPYSEVVEGVTGLFQVGADLWNSYQQRKAQKEFVKKGTFLSDQAYGKARNEMGMGYLAGMLGVMNQDPTVTAKYNDPTYLRQMQTRTPMSTLEAISNRSYANMPNYMQNAPTWQAGLGAQQAAYAAALKAANDARLTIGEQDRNAQNDWLKLMQTNLELNNNNRVEAVNATRLNRNQQVGAVGNQTQGYMDSLANATLGQLSNQLSLEGVRANANVNFSNNIANSIKGGVQTIGTAGISYLDSRNKTTPTYNSGASYGSGVGTGYGGTGPSTPGYTCVGGSQYAINLDGSLVPTGKGC